MNKYLLDRLHLYPFDRMLYLAGPFLLVTGISTYYFQVHTRLAEQRQTTQLRTHQLESLLGTSTDVQQKYHQLHAQFYELEQAIQRTQERLPANMPKTLFESNAQRIAKLTGVQITGTDWKPPRALTDSSQIEVTFRGSGSFASTCRFLNQIDQLPSLTKIGSLKIENSTNNRSYPFQVSFLLVYGVNSHDTERGQVTL